MTNVDTINLWLIEGSSLLVFSHSGKYINISVLLSSNKDKLYKNGYELNWIPQMLISQWMMLKMIAKLHKEMEMELYPPPPTIQHLDQRAKKHIQHYKPMN